MADTKGAGRAITRITILEAPTHDHLLVYVRGASLAGHLAVPNGGGQALAAEMLGISLDTFRKRAEATSKTEVQYLVSQWEHEAAPPTEATRHEAQVAADAIDNYVGNEGSAASDPSHSVWAAVDTLKRYTAAVATRKAVVIDALNKMTLEERREFVRRFNAADPFGLHGPVKS